MQAAESMLDSAFRLNLRLENRLETRAELENTTETAGFHDSMRLDLHKQPLDIYYEHSNKRIIINNWKIPPDNIIGLTIKLIKLQSSYGESLSLGHFQEPSFIYSAPLGRQRPIDLHILMSCIALHFTASSYSAIYLLCEVSSWGGQQISILCTCIPSVSLLSQSLICHLFT